jgi:hypothetical protein
MCRRVECARCARPTYAGCGAHVERVLGDVSPDQRCRCREERAKGDRSSKTPPEKHWIRGLFGR